MSEDAGIEPRAVANLTLAVRRKYSQKRNCFANMQFPHSCVCDRSPYSGAGNMWTNPGNIQIAHRHMSVEIGTEAAQFPEKEYINGIFVAVE